MTKGTPRLVRKRAKPPRRAPARPSGRAASLLEDEPIRIYVRIMSLMRPGELCSLVTRTPCVILVPHDPSLATAILLVDRYEHVCALGGG